MKNKIKELLYLIAKELNINEEVELTNAKGHADISTNVAIKYAKKLSMKPIDLANEFSEKLSRSELVKKVEIAGPGFINIFLKEEALGNIIKEVLEKGSDYGKGNQGKYINIEYISANPTGFLHVGHARNASFGQTLSEVLMFAGNKVDQEYWINDAGSQIDTLGYATYIRYLQELGIDAQLPEDTYRGMDIVEFAKIIINEVGDKYKDSSYEDVKDWFKQRAKEIALDFIKKHIEELGVKMDIWSSETKVRNTIMEEYINKIDGVYEKDGALWLQTTKYGDDKDRVIRKSNGEWTYFAPDIAYHNLKAQRGYDLLIDVWGSDHIGYIERVKISMELSGYQKGILEVATLQFVNLLKDGKELKMSKRMGTSFTMKELVDLIGKDATRYNMISKSENSLIKFDIEEVTKQTNDNPVFGIQYTHARCNQLLEKSNKDPRPGNYSNKNEVDLINEISKWPSLVEAISKSFKVHLLIQYLLDLSGKFNSFYSNSRIIGDDREEELLALVKATKIVLATVLKLIGVSAPNKMNKK